MKICHTSDWHLGRSLYGRRRYAEFKAFLEWLSGKLETEGVDVLLVAGDVFDTSTPGTLAQELYYRFLCRVSASRVRHVVITGGNHDSPSFLNAPRDLLQALNVHVVGAFTGNLADEVIVLRNGAGDPEAVVCAVPYLRDRDLRRAEAGESMDDKDAKLVQGLREHYAGVCALAAETARDLGDIPILAMGHLFTAGGKTVDGDGVRELYVGSLAHVGTDIFPGCIDYLALGHLHAAQAVGGNHHMRYSGSPIPMGFGEARQEKKVVMASIDRHDVMVTEVPVPCFQRLEQVSGTLDRILEILGQLAAADDTAWLEIDYTGPEVTGSLRDILEEALGDSSMEILRIRNRRVAQGIIARMDDRETLDDLDAMDVFNRCLDAGNVPDVQRPMLIRAYGEALASLTDDDGVHQPS